MPSETNKKRVHSFRALLIFGALVALCVSDTVGPRLLPLPVAAGHEAMDWQASEDADVTPAPSPGDSLVVRVAMVAPTRKLADGEHHLHITAHAAAGHIKPPGSARPFVKATYSPAPASSAVVSRPPGRAPPPSV